MAPPAAAIVFGPFITDGRGADWIGSWFGTGRERGLALMFAIAGMIGIVATLFARASVRTGAGPTRQPSHDPCAQTWWST
jgi:DHA3 family multidrug efflux protein-like MFS transporter